MGCTGEKSYEEAVKYEMKRYLNNFNTYIMHIYNIIYYLHNIQ